MTESLGSRASLRFFGDELIPEKITAALRVEPTAARRKGEDHFAPDGRLIGPSRTGYWGLRAPDGPRARLDEQINGLLDQGAADLSVWRGLPARFKADVFAGVFVREWNEGLMIQSDTLLRLGERGVLLDLDIYDYSDEDDGE